MSMHRSALSLSLSLLLAAIAPALQAQDIPGAENFTVPTVQACAPEIGVAKPKIYIANFLVTYGKKTMGRLIADNIAFRFENDERFELISRKIVDKEMSPMFKKNLKAEEYLNLAVSLAAEHKADCVIFGKIGKKGSKISFLVRMASVATGENKIKVDEDVDKKEASAFFERTGDSLVTYFSAAPAAPVIVAEPAPKRESSKVVVLLWGGYTLFLPNTAAQAEIDSYNAFSGSTNKLGGISAGADIWLRVANGFDLGAGIGYLSIWNFKYTDGDLVTWEKDVRFMPLMGQMRLISGIGLYLTGGIGYFNSLTEYSATAAGVKASVSVSDGAPAASAGIGWQIKLGETTVMDLGVKYWHILERSPGALVTPFVGFGFRF